MDGRLRVVLLGTSGSGKSATGNTMLGMTTFKSKLSGSSVTSACELGHNSQLMIVDTPGFYDTRGTQYEKDIGRCIVLSTPGPHIFMFVLKPDRFTECDQKVVASIKDKFGIRVVNFMMILFTRKDDIDAKTSRKEFIEDSPDSLKDLIKECGGRYAFIENERKADDENKKIVDLIRRTSNNGESYYTNEMFGQAMKYVLEVEEAIKIKLAKEKEEQRLVLESEIRDKIKLEEEKKRLDKEYELKNSEAGIGARNGVSDTIQIIGKTVVIGAAGAAVGGAVGGAAAAYCAAVATVPVAVATAPIAVAIAPVAIAGAVVVGTACAVVAGVTLTVRYFIK